MRKLIFTALLFLSSLAFAQNPGVVIVGTAPSGSCPQGSPGQLVNSTGVIWTCQNITLGTGTWTQSGGGGGGSCTGNLGQGIYFSGSNACAGTSAQSYDVSGNLQSITAFEPNTSGSGTVNIGFPGTAASGRYFNYFVNQDTSGKNVMHIYDDYETGTNFVNQINQSYWRGWNIGQGGGKIVSSDSLLAEGMEMTYCPAGTPGAAWPPTAQGQCQDEHHFTSAGINWPFAQVRNMTMASDTLTGITDFWRWQTDVGMTWAFATNDGNTLSGATVTMSGATATFTYSSKFPYDFQSGSVFLAGCSVAGQPSCVNFTPSGYNTLWTTTENCSGLTTCTATAYSGVSGLSSGSGGTLVGAGGIYASLAPTGAIQGSLGGFSTNGDLAISAGGPVVVGSSGDSKGYLYLTPNTLGGGSAGAGSRIYSSGISGSCTTGDLSLGTSASGNPYECDSTVWQPLGNFAVHNIGNAGGFYSNSGAGLGGDFLERGGTQPGFGVAVNYTNDSNLSTCALSTNGSQTATAAFFLCFNTGTPNTSSLASIDLGGQSGITTHIRGGGTVGFQVDSSGNASFPNAAASAGHATCWKTSTTISYCTTIVAADGTCTCH